jgi:hypothetical protein
MLQKRRTNVPSAIVEWALDAGAWGEATARAAAGGTAPESTGPTGVRK